MCRRRLLGSRRRRLGTSPSAHAFRIALWLCAPRPKGTRVPHPSKTRGKSHQCDLPSPRCCATSPTVVRPLPPSPRLRRTSRDRFVFLRFAGRCVVTSSSVVAFQFVPSLPVGHPLCHPFGANVHIDHLRAVALRQNEPQRPCVPINAQLATNVERSTSNFER
jgi:hypothetical protein